MEHLFSDSSLIVFLYPSIPKKLFDIYLDKTKSDEVKIRCRLEVRYNPTELPKVPCYHCPIFKSRQKKIT